MVLKMKNPIQIMQVVNFLKQSNSVIFYYSPVKEQINIDNLQLFNKNNEKIIINYIRNIKSYLGL